MINLLRSAGSRELTPEAALEYQRQRFLRTDACEHNFELFCYTYFPQYFYAEPSVMHKELFAEIQEAIDNKIKDDLADAAPRGNAKSTIVSFALPIWVSVYKKKHYTIIVSDTADQANDFLAAVRAELEDNDLLIDDFGDLVGDVWTNSDLILKGEEIRIQALGAGKKIRGRRYKQWRPDLIICDDLENDENVQSPEQRVKMEGWHSKALSEAGDERTDKIVIGTILHYDSLLAKLLKNPIYKTHKYQAVINWSLSPLWLEWEKIITDLENQNRLIDAQAFFDSHRAEMLEGTKVLWPEKEPYYNLMLQRIADGPAAFSSEKQNEPLSDDERRFHPDWIDYYEDADIVGKSLTLVMFIDPSMGKKGGDYSAIIILAIDENSQVYVVLADIQKRHPDLIISDAITHAGTYDVKTIGVEENQFQEYFKDNFAKAVADLQLNIMIKGIRQNSDKLLRIQSLQPDIKNARVKFKRDQQKLIEQLVNFPSADHDDGPDALEGAMAMLGRRSALADYIKDQAHETNRQTPNSFLRNPNVQRIGE
jgi:predicted phage terminase large subunit-like protein